ncbi:hypothetical protein ACFLYG_01165 [Chloroflexota bacterium]
MRLERRTILFTFLGIIVLTFVAGLLVILGWFPKADPQFGRWIYGVLLVEILGAVVGFFKYRPGAESMLVNIAFPDGVKTQSVEFDGEYCTYEIKNRDGDVKAQGPTTPTRGPGGFHCRLSSNIDPTDYVKLNLLEKNGTKWEVPYFCPYVTNQEAIRRS